MDGFDREGFHECGGRSCNVVDKLRELLFVDDVRCNVRTGRAIGGREINGWGGVDGPEVQCSVVEDWDGDFSRYHCLVRLCDKW